MSTRNMKSLVAGLLLVIAGGLFLAVNLTSFRIDWWLVVKTVLPVLFVIGGSLKLWRYATWPEEKTLQSPGSASLLSGLFWFSLGSILLLDIFGLLETLTFFGLYWPVIIILFGLGKILDYYRFKGGLRIRPAEIFGIVFVVVFGFAANRLSRAHLPLLEDLDWGELSIPIPAELERSKFDFETTETVSIENASSLRIKNLYGDVRLFPSGDNDLRIKLRKTVRADTRTEAEGLAEAVLISSGIREGVLQIGTNREEIGQRGRNLSTHLEITAPVSLSVVIENSFGEVQIREREAPCTVVNAYGRIEIEQVVGDLRLENKYQEIQIENVTGNVTADNRRAGIRLENISGDVDARTDYDQIRAREIGGRINVTNHFGSILLADVGGPIQVDGTGSQVTVARARQNVSIQNSHKDVTLEQIEGDLLLETSYSMVRLKETQGKIDLRAAHSEVSAEELQAGIQVQGKGSQISLKKVKGSIGVETSLRQVAIEGFAGPVTIQNEYGEVKLGNDAQLAGPVNVSNRNGAIVLSLPAGSGFTLSAQAVGGEIVSEFGPTPEAPEGGTSVLETSVGAGGPAVELQTTYSRIQILKRG